MRRMPTRPQKEALRYRRALYEGWQTLAQRPINTNMAESICSQIKGVEMTVRKVPGTALANDKTGEIISTPPVGEKVLRDLLSNWESFLHEQPDLDPLIRMAVMHYQFEAIHRRQRSHRQNSEYPVPGARGSTHSACSIPKSLYHCQQRRVLQRSSGGD